MKLTIELVPESCWYANVRSNINKQTWNIIRKQTYKSADYKCQIYGDKGNRYPVECHEIWDYNDKEKIQTLKGFIALCSKCHEVKHIGRAKMTGRFSFALKHFCKINNINRKEASLYINRAFDLWRQRSLYKWKLDINLLEDYNI